MPRRKLIDTPPLLTIIHAIVDASGSMLPLVDATLSGLNEYIATRQAETNPDNPHVMSLTFFNTLSITDIFSRRAVADIAPLTRAEYQPREGTPLIDAVVRSLKDLRDSSKKLTNPTALLALVITDGLENSSTQYSMKDLRDLVKEMTEAGNFTIAYLGANQDAWAEAGKFAVSANSTQSFAATPVGIAAALAMTNSSTSAYTGTIRGMMTQARASGLSVNEVNYATSDFFAPATPAGTLPDLATVGAATAIPTSQKAWKPRVRKGKMA